MNCIFCHQECKPANMYDMHISFRCYNHEYPIYFEKNEFISEIDLTAKSYSIIIKIEKDDINYFIYSYLLNKDFEFKSVPFFTLDHIENLEKFLYNFMLLS